MGYIVFEGMDGSGKTTLANRIAERYNARRLAFPSRASAVGALIRDVFEGKQKIEQDALLPLLVAEGIDREIVIRRGLAAGDVVACDRHPQFSTLVYQTERYERSEVEAAFSYAQLMPPHRLYVLDVSVSVALERRAKRNEARNVMFEHLDTKRLEAQRERYRMLCLERDYGRLLDATAPVDDLFERVVADLEAYVIRRK